MLIALALQAVISQCILLVQITEAANHTTGLSASTFWVKKFRRIYSQRNGKLDQNHRQDGRMMLPDMTDNNKWAVSSTAIKPRSANGTPTPLLMAASGGR